MRQPQFAYLVLLFQLAVSGVCFLIGLPLAPEGPARRVLETARSVWDRHSLQPPEFQAIRTHPQEASANSRSPVWQDAFAVGKQGELYPKHSLISGILASPFYGLFGEFGFWLFQQVMVFVLLMSMHGILTEAYGVSSVDLTLKALLLLTQTALCIYQFSYDLHGAALILCGFYLARSYPLVGALVAALSLFVRPSHALFLPLVCMAGSNQTGRFRHVVRSVLGLAAGLGLYALVNFQMFGSPFLTPYHRLPEFVSGAMRISNHSFGFSWRTFTSDWVQKLFGIKSGVMLYNPGLLLLPIVIALAWRHRRRTELLTLLGASLAYGLYVFSYEHWRWGGRGNRFLLPAVYLYSVVLITVLHDHFHRGVAAAPLRRGARLATTEEVERGGSAVQRCDADAVESMPESGARS